MAKDTGTVSRKLPTWKLRLTLWYQALKLDMRGRNITGKKSDNKEFFYNSIFSVDGIPEDKDTFDNWVNKRNYPTSVNLLRLERASPLSVIWLKTEQSQDSVHSFCNSLDYYLCSVNSGIKPTLFKLDEQEKFAHKCLTEIAERWKIPFLSEAGKKSWERVGGVQDISLSMLNTHGRSAIPFYLCSLAANGLIFDENILDWYLDLLCSTLIFSAKLWRILPNTPHFFHVNDYRKSFVHTEELIGTNPNLLRLIGNFLCLPEGIALGVYSTSHDLMISEVEDRAKLLEILLEGNIRLRKQLNELGVTYNEVKNLFSQKQFCPEIEFESIGYPETFSKLTSYQVKSLILYHLYPGESNRLEREIYTEHRNGARTIISCRDETRANDSHYSWGYAGTSVYNMAYTLLYDLFNYGKPRIKIQEYKPDTDHVQLVVYKLLSRVHPCCSYTISSEQLIQALKAPVTTKELSKKDRVEFLVTCREYGESDTEIRTILA